MGQRLRWRVRSLTRIWRVFCVVPGQGGLGVTCFHYIAGVGVNPPGFSGDSNWLGDNGVWEDQQCIHRRFGSGLSGWCRSIGGITRVGWAAICSITVAVRVFVGDVA